MRIQHVRVFMSDERHSLVNTYRNARTTIQETERPELKRFYDAYITQVNRPMRLTQAELGAHPAWKKFGTQQGQHPPMRGWLAVPLIGTDGLNYGLIQASDRYEGKFTAEDEENMARLTRLTSRALDALAMVYIPDYREKWAMA